VSERSGKVQTVRGLIEPDEMGITLMHEHLLIDWRHRFVPPAEASRVAFSRAPVSPELRAALLYAPLDNLDNLLLLDEADAIGEVLRFKYAGGGMLLDMSNRGLGRDPLALRRISAATGLHVSMGAGYYVGISHPADMDSRSEDELCAEMVHDIEVGVGDTGIKCGHIGEIGCEAQTPNEMKVVRAAALAQRATGALLNVHQLYSLTPNGGHAIADAIERAGGDLARTVFSHMDGSEQDFAYQVSLLERGLTLEYDLFGTENTIGGPIWFPQDRSRVQGIVRLVEAGWIKQLVLAQDICMKVALVKYGGWGYGHILQRCLPLFRRAGLGEEQIGTLLVDNPRRLLAFVALRG
jgi:phosphotriesterase-related protein